MSESEPAKVEPQVEETPAQEVQAVVEETTVPPTEAITNDKVDAPAAPTEEEQKEEKNYLYLQN